ncbi:MAG: ABC transporter ATP-binding protein [Acidobacteriota bacterium]
MNLQVPKGSIFGFLGPNGSGKSTTVKMLTGLLTPTSGEVFISGLSILDSSLAIKQIIGVLPESQALFESLTIWEHLLISGQVYGLNWQETEKRSEQLLKHLDLWEGRNIFVDEASYGMKKKCSLAMALIHNPKILFLDEPFEGIDPSSSRNIKELLLLLASKGVTIFLTSHILEVVERLVECFAIIVNGQIVCCQGMAELGQSGNTLEDIYFKYVKRYPVGDLEWLG